MRSTNCAKEPPRSMHNSRLPFRLERFNAPLQRRDENKTPLQGAGERNSNVATPLAIDWYAKIRR
jgi:hypothetical protein